MRFITTLIAVAATALSVMAQPSAVKNVSKSVFTLSTFDSKGNLLSTSHGIFVDTEGTSISDWTPFVGASRAVVTDASGKRYDVDGIIGANEIYDVAKFHVKGKTTPLAVSPTPAAEGSAIYLVGYSQKKGEVLETKVEKVETFLEQYSYYVIKMQAPDNCVGCPFVDSNGKLIGFLQQSKYTTDYHSTDARYIISFETSAVSGNNPLYRRTAIPNTLPTDIEQAQIALMLSSQSDSVKYANTINNFIELFPDAPDGYFARAQKYVNSGDMASAQSDMETAIKRCTSKDEAHYDYARIIYQKELYRYDISYPAWNLDKAIEEARQAYSINPQPLYRHMEGQIQFTKKEYQAAYDIFMQLTQTNMRNPELFYEAAQCKSLLEAPKGETIALLDSAISLFKQPYSLDAAPYFLYRAAALEDNGDYRKAVQDYNQYDSLLTGRLGADFYYKREQCEIKGRQFKQAIDDINKAVSLAPYEPVYMAEKASLLLRVNMVEEAYTTANDVVTLDPQYDEAYLLRGLAQIQLGKKKEGLQDLNKALELGNQQAQQLIDKYK